VTGLRPSRAARSLFTVGAVMAGLFASSGTATAAPTTRVTGTSLGRALKAESLLATTVSLSTAQSQIDSSGIGGGSKVATGSARPAQVVVGGLLQVNAADSSTSAPADATDSDGLPTLTVPAGVLTAKTLSSGSSADAPPPDSFSPRSTNGAFLNQATVLKPLLGPAVVDAATIGGSAESRRSGPAGNAALSTARAEIERAAVNVAGVTISVKGVLASAAATATGTAPNLPGGSQGQVSECRVAEIKINATTLTNIGCQGQELSPIPGIVSIRAGVPTTAATAASASAKVDVLTITAPLLPLVNVVLGSVDVTAGVAGVVPAPLCSFPARPTSSGSATGDVVQVSDTVPGLQVDALLSEAAIDEAGVDGSPDGAVADGIAAQVQQPTVPILTKVGRAHAAAPPASSDSFTLASVGVAPLVTTTAVDTNAAATAAADRSSPAATADATADTAAVGAGPILGLSATTVASQASSTKNPANVTSFGRAEVESLTGTVAGLPVSVQALKSSATAAATGTAGGASATTAYEFASVQVGSLVLNSQPAPGTSFDVPDVGIPLVRVTFGVLSSTTAPAGTSASASADALVIEVLPTLGPITQRVVIGHSDAAAVMPAGAAPGPGAVITKDVDIEFDATDSFGDSGATVSHGQKFKFLFCVANTGTVPLNQLVITDVLHPEIRVPAAAAFPLPPNVSVSGSNVLTTTPFSLAPGASISLVVVLETRDDTPDGLTITNSATLTGPALPGPVTSNTIVLNTGVVPTQPAVGSMLQSRTFDSSTRILTLNLLLPNQAGASTAIDARIEDVTPILPAVPQDSFPILLGNVAPGTSVPFTIKLYIPVGQSSFLIDIYESASSPGGSRYAFD